MDRFNEVDKYYSHIVAQETVWQIEVEKLRDAGLPESCIHERSIVFTADNGTKHTITLKKGGGVMVQSDFQFDPNTGNLDWDTPSGLYDWVMEWGIENYRLLTEVFIDDESSLGDLAGHRVLVAADKRWADHHD